MRKVPCLALALFTTLGAFALSATSASAGGYGYGRISAPASKAWSQREVGFHAMNVAALRAFERLN